MDKNEILTLVEKVHKLKKGEENTLPSDSYFLEENVILCYPTQRGDSRYPYYHDGLVLFAHSDGYIDCIESLFNVFKIANYNEDTPVAFFVGEKRGDKFFPVSITGAARQLFEENIERYVIYTPVCAYYMVESSNAIYCVKMYVSEEKHIHFTAGVINLGDESEIYLCSYFEPTLKNSPYEDFFDRMTKYGEHFEDGGFVIKARGTADVDYDYLSVRVKTTGEFTNRYFTTAKNSFVGNKGGNVTNAVTLKNGVYCKQIANTNTTDIPIISDLLHFDLKSGEFVCIDYEMMITSEISVAKEFAMQEIDIKKQDALLEEQGKKERIAFENMNISFF